MTLKMKIAQPTDPYDQAAWSEFYAANPGWRRSVGAEGVNDDTVVTPPVEPPVTPPVTPPATPPVTPPATPPVTPPVDSTKPSDKEAELLRDMMKHKTRAKEAEEALAKYKGVDPEEYATLKSEKVKKEEEAALARGEFKSVRKQMAEAHAAEIQAEKDAIKAANDQISSLQKQISDLTIGSSFQASKFVIENTVLTPRLARAQYGDYFAFEDGQIVGYDKPSSAKDRAPLVGANGQPLAFDAAIARLIESEPDKEDLLKSSIKSGSNSNPPKTPVEENRQKGPMSARDKITAGVGDLLKQMESPINGMPKLG